MKECEKVSYTVLWTTGSPHLELGSDGDCFIAKLRLGLTGETYVEVGYSSPNMAWTPSDENTPVFVAKLKDALDAQFAAGFGPQEHIELYLPKMLKLCEIANDIYNRECL